MLELGTRVKIKGIRDEDRDLNGRVGELRSKVMFPNTITKSCNIFGDIGVILDPQDGFTHTEQINVLWSEIRED